MRPIVSFVACGVCALVCAGLEARPVPHIRSAERHLVELLGRGCQRSATFARLVARIEQSDVLVYVESGRDVPDSMVAYLRWVGAGAVHRYVRVKVKTPARDEVILSLLAHELQHAAEVADAPDVRSEAALEALYRRIGDDSGAGWDSAAARAIGPIVRAELRDGNRRVD